MQRPSRHELADSSFVILQNFSPDRDAEAIAADIWCYIKHRYLHFSPDRDADAIATAILEIGDFTDRKVSVPTGMQRPSRLHAESKDRIRSRCFSPDRDAEAIATSSCSSWY